MGQSKSISFIPIFMGDIYIYMRSAVPANPTGVVVFSPWGPPNRVSRLIILFFLPLFFAEGF